tara:strand:- start:284 stop:868 length:585 start_codon:yes stop_codon:yes gene_type:complete
MSYRTEEKITINNSRLSQFKDSLFLKGAKILFPKRKIESLYLDNSNYQMYHDSIEGSLPRKKIRIRNYKDGKYFKEVKISSTEGRFKTSNQIKEEKNYEIKKFGLFDEMYGSCKPVLFVEYEREYFKFKDFRVTIDNEIKYFSRHNKFLGLERHPVIELKASIKKSLNELMIDFPYPRTRFSKYSNGIEKLLIQ